MRALVYEAPEVMNLRRVPVPTPGGTEVVVRVAYSGICGSELSGFLGRSSIRQPPLVFGHEVSGVVDRIGKAVPDGSVMVGDRVTINPLFSCGACRYCHSGRQQLCPKRVLLGAGLPGCNAEFVTAPAASVYRIPEAMPLISAALVEPTAFALRAVEISGAGANSSALVIGAGPIGLLILQVLAASGVRRLFVSERNEVRLAAAVAAGAVPLADDAESLMTKVRDATGGFGVDVAFDAVGTSATRRTCLDSVAAGGRLVLVGLHSDGTELPLNSVIRSEITIAGAFAYSQVNFENGLDWLAAGRVALTTGVVTAPLADGPEWFRLLVAGDPAIKVLLAPDPGWVPE